MKPKPFSQQLNDKLNKRIKTGIWLFLFAAVLIIADNLGTIKWLEMTQWNTNWEANQIPRSYFEQGQVWHPMAITILTFTLIWTMIVMSAVFLKEKTTIMFFWMIAILLTALYSPLLTEHYYFITKLQQDPQYKEYAVCWQREWMCDESWMNR